jgi:sugar lactone lactonase YvrE
MTLWRKVERDIADTLGEGTLWCPRDGALYWTDILAPALNRLDLASGAITRWTMPEPLGWVAAHGEGGLLGGFRSGVARITLDPLEIGPCHDPEPHLPGNRMNDGKVDHHGAIWCGTMDMAEEEATGALYRLAPDGTFKAIDTDYNVPNGPAFSPCGQWLYHADSGKRTIYRFALEAQGPAGARSSWNWARPMAIPTAWLAMRKASCGRPTGTAAGSAAMPPMAVSTA